MKQKKVLSEWEKKDKNYLDKKKEEILDLGQSPHLSPACGGGGARARHAAGRRRRWLVPDTAGETPEQGRRAAVTAISAMARNGAEEGRGGIPIPRRRKGSSFWLGLSCTEEVEMEVVLQRRRRRRRRGRDHDDDIYGCRGGSIHRIARCEWEVGSLCFTLSSPLLFSSPLIYTSTPLSLSLYSSLW